MTNRIQPPRGTSRRMNAHALARRGFTLIELLLSLIVTAIVGAALIRMVLGQTRFMDQQEAWRGARSVARGSVNRLLSDLRAVEATGGVFAAVAGGQDFTVRVPYAFGIICSTAPGLTVVSLLPVDSAMFAAAGYSGFAWRNAAGTYAYISTTTAPAVQANNLACQNALPTGYGVATMTSINGSPVGRTVNLAHVGTSLPTAQPNGALVGSIVFLYRRVRYQFKNSTALPGRTGLFRTPLDGGVEEELATPFANTARVNFYVLNNATAQAAVPASLGDIRGFELVLDGMSERTPQGSAAPKTVNVRTSVFFENRPD
jgi:prepilin-type N-terminal cleavage/methylation domain-containing protein